MRTIRVIVVQLRRTSGHFGMAIGRFKFRISGKEEVTVWLMCLPLLCHTFSPYMKLLNSAVRWIRMVFIPWLYYFDDPYTCCYTLNINSKYTAVIRLFLERSIWSDTVLEEPHNWWTQISFILKPHFLKDISLHLGKVLDYLTLPNT